MNIKDYQYFAKLAELKSFRLTATYYQVKQPTISYAIKRLEEYYQVELIKRNHTQAMQLTSAGKRLKNHVNQILNQLELAQKDIDALKNARIKLGIPPSIGTNYFPKIAKELLDKGLLQSLVTVEGGSKGLLRQVKNGTIELALLGSTELLADGEIIAHSLGQFPFKVIVSKKQRLAKLKSVSFKELANENFIIFNENFVHVNVFEKLSASNQVFPTVIQRTSNLTVLKELVENDLGISLITQSAIDSKDDLVQIDLVDPIPNFYISLIYRQSFMPTVNEQAIIDIIKRQ